ncbi:hypothetical protein JQK87_17335 [Streptomyces sp. G44]|uniref:hypothetical protein n=1 Tax=Streptomyces sp. G44 TaxID=2807632 RepID=UPI0019607423|nr:hypothetical protein [Streptomyces sp. G44]MBM7170136.1 hypothetical protein [Streptomyces sp. G44]
MSSAVSATVTARGNSVDGPADWALFTGILVLYLAVGFGLEFRAKRRGGAHQPVKAAARGLCAERQGGAGAAPGQYLASRMVMLAGGLATGLAGYLSRSASTAVQMLVMGAMAACGVVWCHSRYA